MATGCFVWGKISLVIVLIDISSFVMSGNILCKMLVWGFKEMIFAFPLKY
jgi:hypothetical protein